MFSIWEKEYAEQVLHTFIIIHYSATMYVQVEHILLPLLTIVKIVIIHVFHVMVCWITIA